MDKMTNKYSIFLSAGDELTALRRQQRERKEIPDDIDMDLLLGSPAKEKTKKKTKKMRSKKPRYKCSSDEDDRRDMDLLLGSPVNERKTKKTRSKKPRYKYSSDEDDSLKVLDISDDNKSDDEEKSAMLMKQIRTEQKNMDRKFRLQTMEQPKALDEDLIKYLSKNDSLDTSINDASFEDIDVPLTVLVRWQFSNSMDKHTIKKYQTFERIFQFYADKENISKDNIILEATNTEGGTKQLQPWYTPDAVKFNGPALVEGYLFSSDAHKVSKEDEELDDGKIELKMQLKGRRDRLTVRIGPQEHFKLAMRKIAEQISQPVEKLRFHFDGELVTADQTPEDLDLDGGEMFDVQILS